MTKEKKFLTEIKFYYYFWKRELMLYFLYFIFIEL